LFGVLVVNGQCPNEATLAAGGTFSGNCTVNVDGGPGSEITITGNVIWTSGTLRIEGNDGDLNIAGSLTIQNGATVRVDDNNDGFAHILDGGSLIVEEGGTFYSREEIQVQSGGSMTISGTVYSENDEIDIDNGGSVTVTSTGSLSSGGNNDILVQGNLEIYGLVDSDDDFHLSNGAVVNIYSGGTINAADDVSVSSGSTFNIGAGSQVILVDEVFIDDSNVTIAGQIQSTSNDDINVSGTSVLTVNAGADVTFNDMEFGTGDGTTQFIMNGGNVNLNGEVDFNGGTDGDLVIINGGILNVDNELEIGTTNGTITINGGGILNTPAVDGSSTLTAQNTDNIVLAGGSFMLGGVELPVDLISFKGQLFEGNQMAKLEWITGSEDNNLGFYIERSIDGLEFEEIGFVEGNGSTSDIHEYTFMDYTIVISSYYRLRQVDYDGQFEYSPWIYVSMIGLNTKNAIKIYPNPTHGNVSFGGLVNEIYDIEVLDIAGKVIINLNQTSLKESESIINRAIEGHINGIFLFKFVNPGYAATLRLIKK
jgi:hypothetical protein